MIFENRSLLFGILVMLSLPVAVTLLAFYTLASTPPEQIVAGTPLVQTPTATPATQPTRILAPDPNPIYQAGLAAFAAQDFATAETRFREALAIVGTDSDARTAADLHNSLGLSVRQQGRLEEAVAVLQTAVLHDPTFAEAHYNLAATHQTMSAWREAEAAYQAALAADPTLAVAANGLGDVYQALAETAAAVTAYEQALALDKQLQPAYTGLARVLVEQERFEEAVGVLETAVLQQPNALPARYDLGILYAYLGQPSQAQAQFSEIIRLDPASDWAAQANTQLNQLEN